MLDFELILECISDYNSQITIFQLLTAGIDFDVECCSEIVEQLEKHFCEE